MTVWRTADPAARLTDPTDAEPPFETSFAEAQAETNFVVFEPAWLPDDCELAEVTLRPEQPPGRPEGVDAADIGQTPWSEGNPCALRAVVEGGDRRARLKEFLYDWGPPAASVAPLWETPSPTPFDCGGAVGWLGTDYKGNRGACVQRDRTQIEISVLDGAFDDDELQRLLSELTPATDSNAATDPRSATDPNSAPACRVPFHALNYWVRYRCEPVAVPHGVWDYSPLRPYHESTRFSPAALPAAGVQPLVPAADAYVLDSAVEFPEADAVESVYRHRGNGSDHLWLTAAAAGSPLAPDIPPEPADQPAETRETVELRGTTIHYGALTEDRGAWEALWSEGGVRYAVHAGASPHSDGEGFRTLVDDLRTP